MPRNLPDASTEVAAAERVVEGIGVAPGIVVGPALAFVGETFRASEERVEGDETAAELRRFKKAVARAEAELGKIAGFARDKLGESSADIFHAQTMILSDTAFHADVEALICGEAYSAAFAVQTVLGRARKRMEASPSEYLRDRAGDWVDVQNRLLRTLQQAKGFSKIETGRVVVAENLTAADLLLFSRRDVLGCAIDFGGATSHVSIMARALGIPAVVSLHGFAGQVAGGETVVLDGFSGRVVLNPSDETLAAYRERQARYERGLDARQELVPLPAETKDGHRIALRANVELEQEFPLLKKYGAEGIGLFRTEMLLLAQGHPIDEEEQTAIYREAVRAARPHPTTFRLLDLGGDKLLPMAHREHNPSLGWRGIRILLDKPDLLRPQLRAILRAATGGPARILLPMVSTVGEVRRTRAHIDEAAASLQAEGLEHEADLDVGIMVEVPSVVLLLERFAPEVDFLSIGSNDLTQFTLAVDRGNDLIADRYHELHPAVLRLIAQTAEIAERHGLPVSLCGEMASNPRAAPLLVGLGLSELSASPAFLLDVKRAVRSCSKEKMAALAAQALEQPDAQSVVTLMNTWLREHVPELAVFFDGSA
ncbi:MAG: phosphoenolpyruvate--protein phosphotransferase [Bacteroidota bacterium]